MANSVVIDITAQFSDKTSGGSQKLLSLLDKLDARISKIADEDVNPKISIETSGFEKKCQSSEQKLKRLNQSKAAARLDAIDNASKKIGAATSKAEQFAKKAFRATLGIIDGASKGASKIAGTIKGIVGTGYNFTLGIVDKVTAPARNIVNKLNSVLGIAGLGLSGYGLVVKPIEMQVDYENLTTAFDVLLGGEDKAQKRIEELTAFAGKTPFTRDEIYKANRILQVYTGNSLGATNALGGVKMVGDIAAGTESDFTSVATWVGRLYSAMEGGKPIGEMSAALQDMGALSSKGREKLESLTKEVESGAKTITEVWPEAVKEFSQFDGIMEKQSNKLGNLLLGVKSFVTNNFLKKIGSGISSELSPALSKFRDWRSENSNLIGKWGSQVEDFAAKVTGKGVRAIETLASKASAMMGTKEWKNADFFGKLEISWDTLIGDPFSQWWDGKGKRLVARKLSNVGSFLGRGATTGLARLLGLDVGGAVDDGAELGSSFLRGFKNSFGKEQVQLALDRALENAPETIKCLWNRGGDLFGSLKISWNEYIAEPFQEWWGTGGKEMVSSAASKAGTWLGEGITHGVQFLSSGILSLLGIENDGVFSEAADVGKSFWGAFTNAIDGEAISDSLAAAVSGVWSKLPGWAQMLIGGYGVGKAASVVSPLINAGRGVASFASGTRKAIGSASQGTGLLGLGANAAMAMGGGNLSATASMSAGGLSALGLGAIGGGIAGGVTLLSAGGDIVNAVNSEGNDRAFNGWKAGSKIGGVGVGAAAGAAIGSIIPGVGTLIGALIGAGLGGIGGSLASDSIAKWATGYEEAAETAEEYEKRMHGLDDALLGYSEKTKEAIRRTKLTGDEFKKIEKSKLDKWYGDVSISAQEAAEYADKVFTNLVGADTLRRVQELNGAIQDTESSLASMRDYWNTSRSLGWKIQAGIELSDRDMDSYRSSVEGFVSSAQKYIDNEQYSVHVAMNLLLGVGENGEENPLIGESDAFYEGLRSEVSTLSDKIHEIIQGAFDEDNNRYNITIDQEALISSYMEQIEEITEKINTANRAAAFETIKLKYDGVELDADSQAKLSAELDTMEESLLGDYDEAFEVSVRSLSLRFQTGDITEDEYNAALEELREEYRGKKLTLEQEVEGVKLSFSDRAFNEASNDAGALSREYKRFIQDNFASAFENFDFSQYEKLLASGEGKSLNWEEIVEKIFPKGAMSEEMLKQIDEYKADAAIVMEKLQEAEKEYAAAGKKAPDYISEGIEKAREILESGPNGFYDGMWQWMADQTEEGGFELVADAMREKGEKIAAGLGESLVSSSEVLFPSCAAEARGIMDDNVQKQFSQGFDADAEVRINLVPRIMNSIQLGLDAGLQAYATVTGHHASGGFVHGKQLSWLDEENYGESIIPFNPARRARALDIWYESGRRLGVPGYANGGIVGGESSVTPIIPQYNGGSQQVVSSANIQVSVNGLAFEVHVTGDRGDVVEQIKAHATEIADVVAGEIADQLKPQFDNTPATA